MANIETTGRSTTDPAEAGAGAQTGPITPPAPDDRGRDEMPRWIPKLLLLIVATIAGALAAYWFLGKIRDLIIWLIVALFLSFALEPAVNYLVKRGWRRGLATGAWTGSGVLGPEAFHAVPFLDLLNAYGSPWGIEERGPQPR